MAAKKSAKKSAKTTTKKLARKRVGAKRSAKKATAKKASRSRAPIAPPRADKGEGEPAIQARIGALPEPARSVMAKLHRLVMKHGKGLTPTVKWGFAVYTKGGEMVLVAAPRAKHVSFGYTLDAPVKMEPVEYTSADQVEDAQVAAIVKRIAA